MIFVWNNSHSEKNSARSLHKCTLVLMLNILYSCQIWMQLEFSGQFFEKSSSNFIKIRPVGAEMFHADGRSNGDRHDETNRQFSQFCRRAQNQSLNYTPLRINRRAVVEPSVRSCIPFWVITGTVDGQSFGNYYLFPAPVLQAWNCGNLHCTLATDNAPLIFF